MVKTSLYSKRPTKNRTNAKKTASQLTSKKSTNVSKPNERQLFDRIAEDHFPKHLHLKFSFYAIFDKWHEKNPSKRTESYQVGIQIMFALTAFDELSKSTSINMYQVVNDATTSDENWLESIWGSTVNGAEWIWDNTADLSEYIGDAVSGAATWSWDLASEMLDATVKTTKKVSAKLINSTSLFLNLCVQAIKKYVPKIELQQEYVKTFRLVLHTWKNSDLSLSGIVTLCTDLIKIFTKPLAGASFDSFDKFINGSLTVAGLKLKWKVEKKLFLIEIPGTQIAFTPVPVLSYNLDSSIPFDMIFRPSLGAMGLSKEQYLTEQHLVAILLSPVVKTTGKFNIGVAEVGNVLTSGIGWVKNTCLIPFEQKRGANYTKANAFIKKNLPTKASDGHSRIGYGADLLLNFSGGVSRETGGFPGKGWAGDPKDRPIDMFDLAGKIHDFGYHVNKAEFTGETFWEIPSFNLFLTDKYTLSRKAKCDYIFRLMTQTTNSNFAQSLATWVANILFSGSSPSEFVKNDKFINLCNITHIVRDNLKELDNSDHYLMIPYQKLSQQDQNNIGNDKTKKCPIDTNPGWRDWAKNNVSHWKKISSLS